MNLAQHAQSIAEKCGLADAATVAKVKGWLAERHGHVWSLALWREALTLYTPSVLAGATHVVVPDPTESVPAAGWDRAGLFPSDEALQFSKNLETLFNAGTPQEVADVGTVGITGEPGGALLQVFSSASNDTSTVQLEGMRLGRSRVETFAVNGTSPVLYSLDGWDLVRRWSRTVGPGTLTLQRSDTAALMGQLGPTEVERQFVRLRLLPAAQLAGTMLILAKRACPAFTADAAVMGLPPLAAAAVAAFAHANTLEWMRQYAKAADKVGEAQAFLRQALENDVFATVRLQQIVPSDGVGSCRLRG